MPIQEDYLTRIEELEGMLYEFLGAFQTGPRGGNSTFEGGKSILDIEVSDEIEELICKAEMLLEASLLDEPLFEEED